MRLVLTTAFILTVAPVALRAQVGKIEALALETGTRARILAAAPDSRFTVITVVSAGPDSLRYRLAGSSDTRALGWQQISRMDASVRRHRHVGSGLGLGFVTGTLAGIALGAAGQHGEQRALNELSGAIGGALFGTIIGGAAGFSWRSEKWIPVYLPGQGPITGGTTYLRRRGSLLR